jgi:anti-anti-sigma regulatory factor
MSPRISSMQPPLKLPAHCVTTTAEALRAGLVLACDAGAIEIDASEVESLGQAVLQLLVAACAEAVPFTIANPSPAFVERVVACRLGGAIGLTAGEESVQ